MSKVVKLKLSDLENIVKKVISEGEFDDFDTQDHPEGTKDYEDYEAQSELNRSEEQHDPKNIVVGKDPNGNIIVMDVEKDEILGIKKI